MIKRYFLVCPHCRSEDVYLPAARPEEPYCLGECESEVDIDEVEKFVKGWQQYLADREALLKKESDELAGY